MSRLKDLDYKNKNITKPGWRTPNKTRFLWWREPSGGDPIGLYVCESYDNTLYIKGFVYDLDDKIMESEGWEEYEA